VAMTPTVHPAAAGTQRSREIDRLRGREADSVTNREDIRFSYGMPMPRRHGIARVARSVTLAADLGVLAAKLAPATVSGEGQRQQVESRSHRWPFKGLTVRSPAPSGVGSASADGFVRDRSAPGPAYAGLFC
jgi:hypothetical protein